MKGEFETQKAKHLVDMKDREVDLVSKESAFKNQLQNYQKDVEELKKQASDIEQREIRSSQYQRKI